MHYHLFELRNNKPDWTLVFESAVCDICARESRVPVPKPDIWTGLGLREWRRRGIERQRNLL